MSKIAYPPPPRADAHDSVYAALREGLRRNRFYTAEVLAYTGLKELGDLVKISNAIESPTDGFDQPLGALCQIFLWSRAMQEGQLRRILGDAFIDAAVEVGLLATYEPAPGTLRAQVALYPLPDSATGSGNGEGELWAASDRLAGTEEERESQPPDVVFCPLAATGSTFLNLLPKTQCARFLEVCAGCAPAALLARDFASEIVASDLAARSVEFARFLARLNQCHTMSACQGASYEAVDGQFDLIAAHPPYMPAFGETEIYYGGGSTGMDVTESLVRGLPEKLLPGGIFFSATFLLEGPNRPAEQLVRDWLGSEADAFDVLIYPQYFQSVLEIAQRAAIKSKQGYPMVERAFQFLAGQGFQVGIVGLLVIRRRVTPGPAATARRRLGEELTWKHILWSLDAESRAAADADGSVAMAATYKVTNSVELVVIHRPSPEGFAAAGFKLKTASPFAIETQVDGWMSYLLARADGSMTGRQLMDSCIADQMILPETPQSEFAKLLWTFVGGAALESSACPLPGDH